MILRKSHPSFASFAWLASCASLVLVIVTLVALVARPARAAGIQELPATTKGSVVLLNIFDAGGRKVASGSGFFVAADGKIVTNHHVIEGAVKVTANLADGRKIDCLGILADDEEKDLAIVKIPGDGYPPLTLGDSHKLRQGDEVVVIGSPLGLSGTVSAGIVSALRDAGDDDEEESASKRETHTKSWGIQVTAAISPGSSGSPIMTPAGEVIAVAVGAITGGQALNFGIPIEEVKTLLVKASAASKPEAFTRGTTSAVRKNLAISAAFFAAMALVYFAVKRWDRRKQPRTRVAIRRPPPS